MSMQRYSTKRNYKSKYRRQKKAIANSRYTTYSNAASQLWNDVKYLKNLINVEFKFYDTNTSGEVLTTTAYVTTLNNIVQGDSDDSRDGQSMRMKSVQCDGTIARGSVDCNVKLLWVLDLQPPLGAPVYSTMFASVAGDITASLRNLDNRSRFIILKEQQFYLTSNNPHRIINYYRKLDAKVFYSDATATYTSVRKNGLFMMAICNQATNGPTLNCKNRIRFIDN